MIHVDCGECESIITAATSMVSCGVSEWPEHKIIAGPKSLITQLSMRPIAVSRLGLALTWLMRRVLRTNAYYCGCGRFFHFAKQPQQLRLPQFCHFAKFHFRWEVHSIIGNFTLSGMCVRLLKSCTFLRCVCDCGRY